MSSKASRIRTLLEEGGHTREEIAAAVGCTVNYVRLQERFEGRRQDVGVSLIETKQRNQQRFLENLEICRGIMSDAARMTGISTDTPYVWQRLEPEFKEKVDIVKELSIDFVESCLFQQIESGEVASTIFFLKTRAKHRGYVERTEHTGPEGRPMDIRVIVPQATFVDERAAECESISVIELPDAVVS